MQPVDRHSDGWRDCLDDNFIDSRVTSLVAKVYQSASGAEKCDLVRLLIRPLGVLSLAALAHGSFFSIRMRSDGYDSPLDVNDLKDIKTADILSLVSHVQQVRIETFDDLAQLLSNSSDPGNRNAAAELKGLLRHPAASSLSRESTAQLSGRRTDQRQISPEKTTDSQAAGFYHCL
ncbi:MAG: hypothetical protein V4454_14025 [Pseudomonadota bacterium]